MRKSVWIQHMIDTTGLKPPSQGGSAQEWKDASKRHLDDGCPACKDRLKTTRATRRRKERDACMGALGLTKVKSVSGKTYWE